MVGMSRLIRLVKSLLNVTPNARNVDQIVACSRLARSLTLMTGTSTAYPPLTGIISQPPVVEHMSQAFQVRRCRRSPTPHRAPLRVLSIRKSPRDRVRPEYRTIQASSTLFCGEAVLLPAAV